MHILCFPTPPYSTNMYLVYSEKTKEAVIIDPGMGSFEIVSNFLKKHSLNPAAVWLTHSHWDHIVDATKVKKGLSLPIYIHKDDAKNLEWPGSDKVPMAVPEFEGVIPDHLIADDEILKIGEFFFKVIHTPGHSPGGVCFYCETEKILFSGDTLFQGAIGSICLPTSEPHRMRQSLERLAFLPPDTKVFPGHGPSTTIGAEGRFLKRDRK